jgi:PAS domain S-box-containing protein
MEKPDRRMPQRPNIKFPVWLTTFFILLFLILMALTVNHALRKGVAEPFSREELTVVLAAAGLILLLFVGGVGLAYVSRRRQAVREEMQRLKEVKAWEERLLREKKTIEGIIEGSPIPTFVIDRDHRIILWNKACAELTGLERADMIGTDRQYIPFYGPDEKRPVIADLIVDQDMKGLEQFYGSKKVRSSEKVEGAYEARDYYENLGGKPRHLYFLAAPIFDEKGQIIAAIETLQDVSQEVEMAQHLRDSQEQLAREKKTIEGVIEGSPIPMFVIDRSHRIIFWNRAFTDMSGYEGKEMIGTDRQYLPFYKEKRPVIADLIVDDDVEGLEKYYGKKRVRPSAVVQGAYEARDYYEDLGGKPRHLYFLAAPIFDERGEIIAAIETLQDVTREEEMARNMKEYAETLENEVTENVNLRHQIEAVHNYLRSIVESSPDNLFDLGPDGTVNFISRTPKYIPGLTAEQVQGRHFQDLVGPEHRDDVMARFEEAKRGIFTPFEMEVSLSDGAKRNLLLTARPLQGTDRLVVVQRDITEFKELEKRFYESQKLAAVGQLSAGIAHEVRNPLSSIKMSLQILEKRMRPEGNDLKRFRIAQREVEHLENLVNDVLIFARPEEPRKRLTDIRRILENAMEMVEKSVADKNIQVEYRFPAPLPSVAVDGAMLEQAFLNLYRNAIDAMETGGTLVVGARSLRENGHAALAVEVADNGCGIDDEEMPHLFNPFFTRKSYGTGLGLTQVKKIVDLHQGSIEIRSHKGEGTRVIVTLPVEAGNARSTAPEVERNGS